MIDFDYGFKSKKSVEVKDLVISDMGNWRHLRFNTFFQADPSFLVLSAKNPIVPLDCERMSLVKDDESNELEWFVNISEKNGMLADEDFFRIILEETFFG